MNSSDVGKECELYLRLFTRSWSTFSLDERWNIHFTVCFGSLPIFLWYWSNLRLENWFHVHLHISNNNVRCIVEERSRKTVKIRSAILSWSPPTENRQEIDDESKWISFSVLLKQQNKTKQNKTKQNQRKKEEKKKKMGKERKRRISNNWLDKVIERSVHCDF